LQVDAEEPGELELQLRTSERLGSFTPDRTLAVRRVAVNKGARQTVTVDFGTAIDEAQYVFVCLMPNPKIRVYLSDLRITGVLSVKNGPSRVAKKPLQSPPPGIGIDTFEFWIPERRPGGKNLAISFSPPIAAFQALNVVREPDRPLRGPNAWVAAASDAKPRLTMAWPKPRRVGRIVIVFDTDREHPMETAQWGHPENVIPFCVRHYVIRGADGAVLHEEKENHQTRNEIVFAQALETTSISIEVAATHGTPAAVFRVRIYER
jgi:hypothetical protein